MRAVISSPMKPIERSGKREVLTKKKPAVKSLLDGRARSRVVGVRESAEDRRSIPRDVTKVCAHRLLT
jgi:hypothetical protein